MCDTVHEYFALGISTPVLMTVLAIRERALFLRSFSATKLKNAMHLTCFVFEVYLPMHASVLF